MEHINIPASLNNLGNVGKLQQHQHTGPQMSALQNADIDQTNREEKSQKPNEIDEGEGLIVDPEEKREQDKRKKKKKKEKNKPDKKNRGRNSGKFVDYSA